MRTKVSVFCDRLLEGGWLLAVIVTPLFFNIYSNRVFEPDKLTLLRSIALLMAVAWAVKYSGRIFAGSAPRSDNPGMRAWLRQPFTLATMAVVFVYLVSTIFSVDPRTSILGSYQRLQGTFTTYSYIVIAMVVLHEMRRTEQFERLVTTVILVSFPISLYGIIQHYGIDAMPWGSDVTARVASNMGNAIFVGAFIIMVIPLTAARLLLAWREMLDGQSTRVKWLLSAVLVLALALELVAWISRGLGRGLGLGALMITAFVFLGILLRRPAAPFIRAACYKFLLSVQLMCLIYSQSRGPLLGFIVAVVFLALLYVTIRRWRAAVWAWMIGGMMVLAFLVVFNLPGTPLKTLREAPYIGRLGKLLETSDGTGKVRLLIWKGAVQLIRAHPLRTLVGYGPETMYVAYNKYYPAELAHYESRNASPDRSHNETLDAFVITGLLGFLAYLFIFANVFYYALKWLGLIQSGKDKLTFWVVLFSGSILGLLLPLAFDSTGTYCGVGAMVGFVIGIFVYVLPHIVLPRSDAADVTEPGRDHWSLVWLAAMAAAVLGHFVEINFGIAIASTRTLFWVYLALIAVIGRGLTVSSTELKRAAVSASSTKGKRKSTARRTQSLAPNEAMTASRPRTTGAMESASIESDGLQLAVVAILIGYILSIMHWTFVTNPNNHTDLVSVLIDSFTTFAAREQPGVRSLGMLWLMISTLMICVIVAVAELAGTRPALSWRWWLRALGRVLIISASVSMVFAVSHAARLIGQLDISQLITSFYSWTGIIWLSMGLLMYLLQPRPAPAGSGWSLALGGVLTIAALVLVTQFNINPIRADIIYKQGLRYDEAQQWDGAIQLYRSALDIAPREDYYWLFYGRVLMERARTEQNQAVRESMMQKTLTALEEARKQNPLNTDHTANLARFYRTWAELDTNQETRAAKIETSLRFYEQAHTLSPQNAQIIDEWGQVYFIAGQDDLAMQKYRESLAIDAMYADTYFYMGDLKLRANQYLEAIDYYRQGLALAPDRATAWSALAYAYTQNQEIDKAIEANLQVIRLFPQDYNTLKNLALLYQQQQNLPEALVYAQRAYEVSSGEARDNMGTYIEQLKQLLAGSGE